MWSLRHLRCSGCRQSRILRSAFPAAQGSGGLRNRGLRRRRSPAQGQGAGSGDRGLQRREDQVDSRKHGHRPREILHHGGQHHRERAALPLPPQHRRLRPGPQRQSRELPPAAPLPRGQRKPVPVLVRQRDTRAPHKEGHPGPQEAQDTGHQGRPQHDRGSLRVPDTHQAPHLRLPRQARTAAPLARKDRRERLRGQQQRDLRLRRDGRRVHQGHRARRNSDHRPPGRALQFLLRLPPPLHVRDGVHLLLQTRQRHRRLQRPQLPQAHRQAPRPTPT